MVAAHDAGVRGRRAGVGPVLGAQPVLHDDLAERRVGDPVRVGPARIQAVPPHAGEHGGKGMGDLRRELRGDLADVVHSRQEGRERPGLRDRDPGEIGQHRLRRGGQVVVEQFPRHGGRVREVMDDREPLTARRIRLAPRGEGRV